MLVLEEQYQSVLLKMIKKDNLEQKKNLKDSNNIGKKLIKIILSFTKIFKLKQDKVDIQYSTS